ncbi:MAG: hypothetical protein JST38_09470 [Bacteroidetes bacterium]|nr:hypothetical protein [Bacteroidota bacterium]
MRRETETQGAARALEVATAEDQDARQRLEDAAKALGLTPDSETLSAALTELANQEGAQGRRQEALEDAEAAHQVAQVALNEVRLATQRAEGGVAADLERQRGTTQRLTDEDQRLAQAQAQVEALALEAAIEAKTYGLPTTDLLPEARRRVQTYQAASEALKTAERAKESATREAAIKAQALETAQQQATQTREAVEARQKQLQTAEARCAAVLGGADPEPLEAALQGAVKSAEDQVNLMRDAYTKVKEEADRAQGLLEATRRQVAEAQVTLTAAEAALGALLPAFGTEADLAARALSAEEARRLEVTRQASQRDQMEAASALLAHERQCEAHAAKRPGTMQESDRETLQANRESAQAEAQVHQEAATKADMTLRAQVEARERQAVGMARLEEAKLTLSLWTRMKGLIGTNEGEAFRRFAQVLNLRDLLAKANARLQRLRDRYRLVPAMGSEGERLAFAVVDAAHAGEVRPVSTLSGGETFLVSLSLALALADYRTVRMPIETLLLDEGFGTLDPATLADVLGTLGALTSQGTQVGIISHVEALKEKIPARIQIESLGAGRSRVVVAQ